ncbi:MAG: hypothetical protein U0V02_09075 [Anaerolineales bacterium]
MSNEDEDVLSNPEVEPKRRLAAFIEDVKSRLDEIVPAKHILFHEEIRDPIHAAYDEEIREVRLLDLQRDIERLETDTALENAGLTKKSLHAKLLEYKHIRDKFKKIGSVKIAKQLLESIHIILGSLLDISNVAEPIKEFIELLKLAISESEEATS